LFLSPNQFNQILNHSVCDLGNSFLKEVQVPENGEGIRLKPADVNHAQKTYQS
jgi:hypothetical protein